MKQLTRIVAAVLDTRLAILYREDGTTVEIQQGDNRLRPILDKITPEIEAQGYSDIDLSEENSWKDFEEKTNGALRFFKIAKSKLKEIFAKPTEDNKTIGAIPSKMSQVVDQIIENAVPVKAADFNEAGVAKQRATAEQDGRTPSDAVHGDKDEHHDSHAETIVAVTPRGKVISGVERIKSQVKGAVESDNTTGLSAFFERISKVASRRQHTAQDLLRFLERGDLPIADDGTIVIYKKLYRDGEGYVDPHTQRVKQKLGSLVYMDEKLVDPNRRNECSNGLHVARRGYVRGFSGNALVLAKVRPEDVIAVPEYDANKMRVCAYHIIGELTQEQYTAVCNNRPISDAPGGLDLLNAALSGDHVGVLSKTKIGGPNGTQLTITEVSEVKKERAVAKKAKATKKKVAKKKVVAKKVVTKQAKPLEAAVAKTDAPVDVKKVLKKIRDTSVSLEVEPKKPVTQAEAVQAMWNKALGGDKHEAKNLLDFKKKAKKGWAALGLPSTAGDTLNELVNG